MQIKAIFGFIIVFLSCNTSFAGFWVWDLTQMPPGFRNPNFNRELSTKNFDLWVEENLGDHSPSAQTLSNLSKILSSSLEMQMKIFGGLPTPPSKDTRLHVLIASIPPYVKNGKTFGHDGFFNVFDQLTEAQAQEYGQHSNEKNILYLNALHDVSSDYMLGVATHELNHLLTFGNELDSWLNEMLGEAAMILSGYYTDQNHVNAFLAQEGYPLAVKDYGLSYGAVSLFAEFLIFKFGTEKLGELARAPGNSFEKIESIAGFNWDGTRLRWGGIVSEYVRWLTTQNPRSGFKNVRVKLSEVKSEYKIAPTGILFFENLPILNWKIVSTPSSCASSENTVYSQANALWVVSNPPCVAEAKGGKIEPFVIRAQ